MRTAIRAALAAVALSASAFVQAVTVVLDPVAQGQFAGTFQSTHSEAGNFADTFEFVSPVDGLITITLDSTTTGILSVQFLGYQLTQGPLVFLSASHEVIGPLGILEGPQTLTLGIQAAPPIAPHTPALTSYTGKIVIQALPIPEPGTWLLTTIGLLALASRMKLARHRRQR